VTVSEASENLELEIVSVEPRPIYTGRDLTILLRMSNKGDAYVLLPWQETMVETQSFDKSDSPRKSVEYVSIEVSLGTHQQKVTLEGGVSLQARPSQDGHWLNLKPGEWAEIKFRAFLAPDHEKKFLADPAATLTVS
jgi:hypothetical protein